MADDFDWEQLLEGIRHDSVIPVVGKDLLEVEIAGRRLTVSSYLAQELATDLGVDSQKLPPSPDFADVFGSDPSLCAKLMKNARMIYSKVAHIYESTLRLKRNFPVPPALEKLAEIQFFNLFVSLTCDDLLHRALEAARQIMPISIDNQRRGVPDVTDEQLKSARPIIYRMFGKFAHYGEYALTDEDMLEFMHWLPDRAYRPEKLFDHIQGHDLLLLGTALPDWMACFFLRATRRLRLSRPTDFTQYIVDHRKNSEIVKSRMRPTAGLPRKYRRISSGKLISFVFNAHGRDESFRGHFI
ncbi:MAG: hypothetical protein JOZ60_12125, partial [Verrucomicrobia bacterium]|nr:hypothetical protein [Verrucomicrobiota bacterium]